MQKRLTLLLGLAFAGLIACDDRESVAGLGTSTGTNPALTLLPTSVQITVGSTTQLSTNAGTSTQLSWLSSNTNVATVSSTGLVTGRSGGTATITVRFTTDTTNAASSSVSVTQ